MKTPVFSLNNASISFGRKALFEDLNLHVYQHDRICLTGRNGEGKSTIMKLINESLELDGGERWIQPGFTVGYLPQEMVADSNEKVIDYVLAGLPKHEMEDKYRAEMVLAPLYLDAEASINTLSGGQKRRASLARAIVANPSILLLDEPTNHLDVESIIWLEQYLKKFKGAVLVISHDRAFLRNFSNKVFWLDRGNLRVLNRSYESFEDWSCDILEQEQKELDNLARKMKDENQWLAQGVTARRKRNQRRLGELRALRDKLQNDRARFSQIQDKIELEKFAKQHASKIVAEIIDVSLAYSGKVILRNYSNMILKGEKIGIIGKNGSGKTTFLRLLLGEEEPDQGRIKLGKNVKITYLDQLKKDIDPDKTLSEILAPNGSDQLNFRGSVLHVAAYLKKFMFDPKLMRAKVSTLSGGQANRLLLAKVLAENSSVVILDEPTNDLDMETLDMLQEYFSDYEGTLIIVSHDRDFIDRTVSKTLVFEGNGKVIEVFGGYTDYLERYGESSSAPVVKADKKAKEDVSQEAAKKLTYKLQYEYDNLPKEISVLEEKIAKLEKEFHDPEFYTKSPERFIASSKELEEMRERLTALEMRWLELDEMM